MKEVLEVFLDCLLAMQKRSWTRYSGGKWCTRALIGGLSIMLFFKNLIFTILVLGTVTVLIPYLILSRPDASFFSLPWGDYQFLALPVGIVGISVLLWCILDFASIGRGIPAPIDHPKQLVVHGLYRYVRNPMYLGVFIILLAEATFFESKSMFEYLGIYIIIIHLVVMVFEEPLLRHKFGERYKLYCESVRRWLPVKKYDEVTEDKTAAANI